MSSGRSARFENIISTNIISFFETFGNFRRDSFSIFIYFYLPLIKLEKNPSAY